jgi:hypothetical protein
VRAFPPVTNVAGGKKELAALVIGGFFGDGDVVGVAFGQAGHRNPIKARLDAHILNRSSAQFVNH